MEYVVYRDTCTLDINALELSKVPGSLNDIDSLYFGIKIKQNCRAGPLLDISGTLLNGIEFVCFLYQGRDFGFLKHPPKLTTDLAID